MISCGRKTETGRKWDWNPGKDKSQVGGRAWDNRKKEIFFFRDDMGKYGRHKEDLFNPMMNERRKDI